MKTLATILPLSISNTLVGNANIMVSGLTFDSRLATKDFVFIALKGFESDGHLYINQAIKNGAAAIVCEDESYVVDLNITYLVSSDIRKLAAYMADAFYDHPSSECKLIGVTGTNGKTTTTHLLYQLFKLLGYKCGLISTIGIYINENVKEATHTTPDVIQVNQLIRNMVDSGCDYVFMEVSSHALHQHRVTYLAFNGAIFSNLTHDHLDYHKTFENYRDAKKILFDNLDLEAFALVNSDDKNGKFMLQNSKAAKFTYALNSSANFNARIIENDLHGMELEIEDQRVYCQLSGTFNAYNLLAVYATAFLLNQNKNEIITQISLLKPVSGRFNTLLVEDITVVIDYAHTPDALENVLKTIISSKVFQSNIISVLGCGGNRDAEKRPTMANIAVELSDRVIFTADNPRFEEPENIVADMMMGVQTKYLGKVLKIMDRQEAIKTAILLAKPKDIILIAGKGHEKYQEIKGVKYPFDDTEVAKRFLNSIKNNKA